MQNHDDEQFETYLKRFRPVDPEPMAAAGGDACRRSFAPGVWLAATAAILIVGIVVSHTRSSRVVVQDMVRNEASIERSAPLGTLTIRSANAWLATAPSFKAAVDALAFRPQSNPIPPGKQSAIAVLGEKGTKL